MALGGNSKTAIVSTVSPASMNYYQTLSTLKFANRAKTVKIKPIQNEEIDQQEQMHKLLQKEIKRLKGELKQKDKELVYYQEEILQKDQLNERGSEKKEVQVEELRKELEQERRERVKVQSMLQGQNSFQYTPKHKGHSNFSISEQGSCIEKLVGTIDGCIEEEYGQDKLSEMENWRSDS